jgi:hypothetical protein
MKWLRKKTRKIPLRDIYGFDRTIHRTGEVNVEIDDTTGEVVSVWYRCSMLPFTQDRIDEGRSKEMQRSYEEFEPKQIDAIVFQTEKPS